MRAIREMVPRKDYAGIAAQLRAMKKIWRGTDIQRGMERRREAEARLVEMQ
jgi:GH24 family phage-related lysozyme (muramidase)